MLDAPQLSPMTSPALTTTTEGLPPDSARSGPYDPPPEDTSEFGEENSETNDVGDDQAPKPQPQKRRRVTRACDECRRKKIKCDGKQPCTHCTVYSYECTYDQPSNRRRNATPQYIEALESQLKRAKALLHVVLPTVDLNDPAIDAHLQNGLLSQLPQLPQLPQAAPRPPTVSMDSRVPPQHHVPPPHSEDVSDSHLEAMVKATGQLDLDEEGNWDYQGHSSGLSFMRGLRQFDDMFQIPSDDSPSLKQRTLSNDAPSPSVLSIAGSTSPSSVALPNKEEARALCDSAINQYSAMLRVVHLPTFYKQMDRIYEVPSENYGAAETSFLPLLYAVLALGKLYSEHDQGFDSAGYDALTDEGLKYFKASRQLMDITDCRDLISLQAIIFMIQFLQSSAKLSTCYAYIGVALRSALRMGLHRSFNVKFTPIEAETRKRIFWVIRRMDTYVGAMLGLPRFLEDEDIDQEWPVEVDDEYITETEILPMPEGSISVMAAFNAHTRLVQVLNKICKYVYPIKGTQSGGKNSVTYTVGYSKIREIEQDLARWLDELPVALKPGGEAPPIIKRVQQLLRMAFGHAQLLLYRPFLHYVSQSYNVNTVDQRAFACASACVNVSRNIIHISTEMRKRGLLAGAYWFAMYTTFFAIVSILYFVLENPTSPTSFELLRDAVEGKEVLAYFAKRSLAADRCSTALKGMFERLPESIRHGGEIIASKKRRQGSSPQSAGPRPTLFGQSEAAGPRRASTYPDSVPHVKTASQGQSYPSSHHQFGAMGLGSSYPSHSVSNPNLFDGVPDLTPTSSNDSLPSFGIAPIQDPQQNSGYNPTGLSGAFTDPSGMNVPIADISTMMFPSADPLAYPNQPMTAFENKHPQAFDRTSGPPASSGLPPQMSSGMDPKGHPAMFAPTSMPNGQGRQHNDNEAQLFGPMPMYLMQGTQQYRGYPPQPGMQMSGSNNMPFDELLNQEDWSQSFMDPGMNMSGGRPSHQQFNQHGWR
ncbi:transcriptional activator mut3p [Stemphylium lycopersici]|uniref:Transcriptional activator mut3p n=1 Tax=Stemphylium lycopersici TaxID=183478 RepID=A0A364NFP2_STELY|nr:transcriptional activator mut3p [Stemphylium lycopersici]